MKLMHAFASFLVLTAFILAGQLAAHAAEIADSDHSAVSRSGAPYAYIAIGCLFLFLLSALVLIVFETWREERDKRNRDEN